VLLANARTCMSKPKRKPAVEGMSNKTRGISEEIGGVSATEDLESLV